MRKITTFIILTLFCPVFANAGVLYLEVPEDISIEMTQNPTPDQDEMIDSFILNEINRTDADGADRIVVLTKNGKVIPQADQPADGFKGFDFFREGEMRPVNGNWDNQEWESILDHYAAAYPYAKRIFGAPVVPWYYAERYIVIKEFPDMENTWGAYIIRPDKNEIWLQSWPEELSEPIPRDFARSHLIRNMLSAFRWIALCTWDQFGGGMKHAAWLEIVKEMQNEGYLTQFNDLSHDSLLPDDSDYSRPYYASLEQYNTMEMSTALPDFFSERSAVGYKIKHARYGACGYVWWKLYNSHSELFGAFNKGLTAAWNVHCDKFGPLDDGYRPTYEDLYKLAAAAYEDSGDEPMKKFEAWFEKQRILTNNVTYGHQLLATADRTVGYKGRVFCYERRDPYSEAAEIPYEGTVEVDVLNWIGGPFAYFPPQEIDLDGGVGDFRVLGRWDVQRLIIDAETEIDGNIYTNRNYTYGGFMKLEDPDPWKCGRKKFFGVLSTPHCAGAALYGELYVEDEISGQSKTIEVRWGAMNDDLWDGFGDEPAILNCTFIPTPEGSGFWEGIDVDYTIVRDKGEYGFFELGKEYTGIVDENGNGVDDADELLLMERFKPVVQMHRDNNLHPCRVEVILHHGTITTWSKDYDEIYNTVRITSDNVEQVFDEYDFDSYDFSQYVLTFGPERPNVAIDKLYWWTTWDTIQGEGGIYDDAATYANVFREDGMTIIQYWFYYPFNDWGNDHEGDWEHINVVASSADPEHSGISKVLFYFHKHYAERSRDQIEVYGETHPKVYVGGLFAWNPWNNTMSADTQTDIMGDRITDKETLPINGYRRDGNVAVITNETNLYNYKNCSGGSYWSIGYYKNAGRVGADEYVLDGGNFYNDIDLICLDFRDNQLPARNQFWHLHPGHWGRPKRFLDPDDMDHRSIGPRGPYWRTDRDVYKADGYTGYHGSPTTKAGSTSGESSASSSPAFPFALHQTAPNPSKGGSVCFAFSVPETCEAKLTVYDIKGRIVSIPFNDKIVPGEYATELSTASLPAGVYLYRLEAGSDVAVKKMVITK